MLSGSLFSQEKEYSKYGLKVPTQEHLDSIPTEIFRPNGFKSIKSSWDLTEFMPTPGNQGSQNSCTAWAVAYGLKSYQERVETGQSLNFSPAFVFNSFPNNTKCELGLYFSEALDFIREKGICEMKDMPYSDNTCTTLPSNYAYNQAIKYKIEDWKAIYKSVNTPMDDINEIKAKINDGNPVGIAVWLDSNIAKFMNDTTPNKPKYVWDNPLRDTPKSKYYHAMLCVGYDDANEEFKVFNSYGINSGNEGYIYISYDAFRQVVYEAYYAIDSNNKGSYVNAIRPSKQKSEFGITDTTFNFYGWLKQGYYIKLNENLKLSCAYLRKSKDIVILRLYDTSLGKEKLIGSYKFNSGDTYDISYLDYKYSIQLDKIGGAGYNVFRSAAFINFSSQ